MAAPETPSVTPVQWVNPDRTVLVTLWADGSMEVARRDEPWETWGPPVTVEMERR